MEWKSLDTGKKHSQVPSIKILKMILFFSIFKEDSNLLLFLKIQNTTKKLQKWQNHENVIF